MERYYKVSDVEHIIRKLMKEPHYQHEGEDFTAGVAAIEGELMCIDTIEFKEPRKGKWVLNHGIIDYCTCSACGSMISQSQLNRFYCPACGAEMTLAED